jgi:hypothetical protein
MCPYTLAVTRVRCSPGSGQRGSGFGRRVSGVGFRVSGLDRNGTDVSSMDSGWRERVPGSDWCVWHLPELQAEPILPPVACRESRSRNPPPVARHPSPDPETRRQSPATRIPIPKPAASHTPPESRNPPPESGTRFDFITLGVGVGSSYICCCVHLRPGRL